MEDRDGHEHCDSHICGILLAGLQGRKTDQDDSITLERNSSSR